MVPVVLVLTVPGVPVVPTVLVPMVLVPMLLVPTVVGVPVVPVRPVVLDVVAAVRPVVLAVVPVRPVVPAVVTAVVPVRPVVLAATVDAVLADGHWQEPELVLQVYGLHWVLLLQRLLESQKPGPKAVLQKLLWHWLEAVQLAHTAAPV